MRKLWGLRLKRWNLSMRVSDEDTNLRKRMNEIVGNAQSTKRVILLFIAFVERYSLHSDCAHVESDPE